MWIDVQQNTDEWFNLRLGRATSSNFDKIMANEGKAFGNPAIEYAQKLALETVTGVRDERGFKGKYFDDGHMIEPIAIRAYEVETFTEVTNGGFYALDDEFGDSPDGNVGDLGCVEVKGVIANTQWKRIKKGGYDLSYKWQICGHIWISEKGWCDFISFCPEMPPNKQLYVFRVERDEEMILRLIERLELFILEVKKNIELLKK